MDKIILSGVEFYAYGGVTEAERAVGQHYEAQVELELDLSRAAESDSIDDTVSYAEVFAAIVETAREHPFHLLESLAGRVARRLVRDFPVDRATVQIRKLRPPIDGRIDYAAVEITWWRDS